MLRMKGYYFDLIKIKLSGHNFFIKEFLYKKKLLELFKVDLIY